MRMRFFVSPIILLTAFLALPLASRAQDSDDGELRTGGYIWHPEFAPTGDMSMTIDLSRQRAYVHRDGVCIGISTISSGKPGYETPTGEYTVMEKQRFHRSNRYDNAPMPYMQRLTSYGLALHGGHLPGYPASHGCVRLPHGFAAALFQESYVGMRVTIRDGAPEADDAATYGNSDPPAGLQSCEPDDSP
jgi:hypothetical protein